MIPLPTESYWLPGPRRGWFDARKDCFWTTDRVGRELLSVPHVPGMQLVHITPDTPLPDWPWHVKLRRWLTGWKPTLYGDLYRMWLCAQALRIEVIERTPDRFVEGELFRDGKLYSPLTIEDQADELVERLKMRLWKRWGKWHATLGPSWTRTTDKDRFRCIVECVARLEGEKAIAGRPGGIVGVQPSIKSMLGLDRVLTDDQWGFRLALCLVLVVAVAMFVSYYWGLG